ncbi:MAG: hypothetical protein JRI72_05600 [Deltaproteobacteria bacterium]|nr:hypothetical protein [Deltaproteobacteria bacterium]
MKTIRKYRTDKGLVWIEHPKKGRPIKFREKGKVQNSRYEIEIVPNGSFSGYWVGEFAEVDGGVKLEFTEVGEIHNPIFRVLAYFFFDLEKTIKEYQENLKKTYRNQCLTIPSSGSKKRRFSFLVALLFAAADVRRSQRKNLTLTYIGG